MKRVFILALHEVKLYFQDKADLAFGILLPVVMFGLMYFGFSSDTVFNGTAAVVNNDENGAYAADLLDRLEKNAAVTVKLYSEEDAVRLLERSDLTMVIFIPEEFSDKCAAGQPAELVIRQRGNGSQEGQIVAGIVNGIISDINLELQALDVVSSNLGETGIDRAVIETTVQKYVGIENSSPSVAVTERSVGSRPDMVFQFLPGVVNMFVLFSISMSARVIIEEKKRGTLERLLTTRLSISEMFAGKTISFIARGFIQTLILLLLAWAVFGMFTPASFAEVLVIALVFAASATSIGMVIATIARTGDGATWIAVFFTMAMVMLGGSFFEVSEGSILYSLGRFSLVTYANDAFRAVIAEGTPITELGLELGIMAAVFVVGMVLSRIMFRIVPGGK